MKSSLRLRGDYRKPWGAKMRVKVSTGWRPLGLLLIGMLMSVGASAWAQEVDLERERDRGVPVYARQRPEVDPIGVRAGAFMIYPRAGLSGLYDDNIYATRNDREADFITTLNPGVRVESNWSNHRLAAETEVAVGCYADNQSENFLDGRIALAGRLDGQRGAFIEGGLEIARLHEERGDPDGQAANDEPSVYYRTRANLTGYHGVGRLSLSLGADYTRHDYRSVDLVGGGSASQSDRDYNIYEVQSRIAYELLPNVSPFIQTSYNVRRYDTREPINRESDGYRIGFGTGFDAGGIITGEVYGGYMRQNFVSSRFDDASGPWFGGSLLWNVTRLTSVEVGLERRVVETTNSEASSYNRTALDVRVEHELLRNLLIGTSAHYYDDRYNGSGLN